MKIRSKYPLDKLKFIIDDVVVNLRNTDLKCDSFLAKSQVEDMLQSGEFKRTFTDALKEQLKKQGEAKLNEAIVESPTNMEITSTPMSVSFSQTSNLDITESAVNVFLDGTVYNTLNGYVRGDDFEIDFPEADDSTNHYVQLFITNYVFKTAIDQMYQSGLLSIQLAQDNFPDVLPCHLDTKSLSAFIPGLEQKYGDQPMRVSCSNKADVTPHVEIVDGKLNAQIATSCELFVWNGESDWTLVATVSPTFDATAAMGVLNPENTIAISIERARVTNVEVVSSDIPELNTEYIQVGLNLILDIFVPYTLEIPIPEIPLVTLTNPELSAHDGYISLFANEDATNLKKYHPLANSNTAEYVFHHASGASTLSVFGGFLLVLIALLF